jgi:hypothetical protein
MTARFPSTLTVAEAAAAIVALINSGPRTPREAEIEAIVRRAVVPPLTEQVSAAQAELLAAIHEWFAAEKALVEACKRSGYAVDDEAATARHDVATARMSELANQLPLTRSLTDAVLIAQVAGLHMDGDVKGWLAASPSLKEHGPAIMAAIKVVAAVLDYAGIDLRD